MKKSLVERILSSDPSKIKSYSTRNKIAFLVLRDDISDALEKGYTMTAIWETLFDEGKIATTYNTFRLHVAKYINGQAITPKSKNIVKEKSATKGFVYDPNPDISKLI